MRFTVLHILPFVFPGLVFCATVSVPQLSLENLVAQSDQIVEGQVVRAWAAMDAENKFIWTHYEIKVDGVLKGRSQASVVGRQPGGVLNCRYLIGSGSTLYTVGEQVGGFLYRTPIGYLRTANYGEGKFVRSAAWRTQVNRPVTVTGA